MEKGESERFFISFLFFFFHPRKVALLKLFPVRAHGPLHLVFEVVCVTLTCK